MDHACEFKNLPLIQGENKVWATAGDLISNTITICPVDEPNSSYTYMKQR